MQRQKRWIEIDIPRKTDGIVVRTGFFDISLNHLEKRAMMPHSRVQGLENIYRSRARRDKMEGMLLLKKRRSEFSLLLLVTYRTEHRCHQNITFRIYSIGVSRDLLRHRLTIADDVCPYTT